MSGRIALALLMGSALLAGCDDLHRAHLLSQNGADQRVYMPRQPMPPGDARAEAAAKRAIPVLQKIVDANPTVSVHPRLLTVGNPKKAMFHSGNSQTGMNLYVTDSLVNACTDDAQLAAVLSTGLGRLVAASASRALLPREGPTRIEERIGSDDRGAFGAADGVRLMEAGKAEERKLRSKKPDAAALALGYLTKAGYPTEAMKKVVGLLREADKEEALRDQLAPDDQPARLLKPVPKPEVADKKK
jgi:predicted Zn-dependent protease